jgi:hypothetical protein
MLAQTEQANLDLVELAIAVAAAKRDLGLWAGAIPRWIGSPLQPASGEHPQQPDNPVHNRGTQYKVVQCRGSGILLGFPLPWNSSDQTAVLTVEMTDH